MEEKLPVFKIERFSSVDGEGVRTVVFLKGCPLNCVWCHNPESKKICDEILYDELKCINCGACASVCTTSSQRIIDGRHVFDRTSCQSCFTCTDACPSGALENCVKLMRISEILEVVEKDKSFYGKKGGITLSGGEPSLHGELTVKLLAEAKRRGINTAMETCGYFPKELCEKFVEVVDLFLWDIKDTDNLRHSLNVGVSNEKIVENLKEVDGSNGKTRLRCILLKGVNAEEEHYKRVAKIYHSLKNCQAVELLPYHPYGGAKNLLLGKENNGNSKWILSPADVSFAKKYLKTLGVRIIDK